MTQVKAIFNDSDKSEITDAVNEILKGENPRIASAFLGIGAEETVPKNAKVICDIGMGGTNPVALELLKDKLGVRLKYLGQFHPKLYLSATGCVIGSANFSNNGIGFLSSGNLVEAATFIPNGCDAYKAAETWFDEMWGNANSVEEIDIEHARNAWGKGKFNIPDASGNPSDFMAALSVLPSELGGWKVLVTTDEDMSEEAEEAERRLTGSIVKEHNLQGSENIDCTEWDAAFPKSNYHIVSFHRGPKGGLKYSALRYLTEHKLKNGLALVFSEKLDWKSVGLPDVPPEFLGQSGFLSKLIKSKNEDKEWAGIFFTGEKFAEHLRNYVHNLKK